MVQTYTLSRKNSFRNKNRLSEKIEKLIANELLDHNVLILELRRQGLTLNEKHIEAEIRKEVEKYSSSQTMITDLSGSVMTLLIGWYFFGDKTLGVFGIGDRIARKMAHDKAASGFVFGEQLGSVFYNTFPPEPTKTQVYLITIGVGVLLTAFSLLAAVMSDPLRKHLELHKRNLNNLIESLEEKLFLQIKKEIKRSLRRS